VHPILFQLGPLTLRSFGFMVATGFLLGTLLAMLLNRQMGKKDDDILDVVTWIMLGSVVGARLMYVLVMPGEFVSRPWAVIAVWEGGLVYYGGLIGGVFAAMVWARKRKAEFWQAADVLAPGLALGQALGRMGCFLNGCCYGRVDAEHGMLFPAVDAQLHLPVQLYEAGLCLALAVFLALRLRRHAFAGQGLAWYLLIYPPLRFGLEFLRGDAERGQLLGLSLLSPAQCTSMGLFLSGLGFWYFLSHRKNRG
jgi:phosphatidylglycerol:prolipoprotein diacylglycerol transferase